MARDLKFGLDPSWFYFLNVNNYFTSRDNLIFGRDVFFTSGPLGFLIYPIQYQPSIRIAMLFQFVLWAFCVGLFAYLIVKYSPAPISIAAICFSLVMIDWEPQYVVIFPMLLLFLLMMVTETGWEEFAFLLVILSSISIYIKFSVGILGIVMTYSGLLILCLFWRRNVLRALFPLAITSFLLPVIIYMFYNSSLKDLTRFFVTSMELSRGYSAAMSYPTNLPLDLTAVLYIVIFLVLSKTQFDSRDRTLLISIGLLPAIIIMFKGGMVRADYAHIRIFYTFVIISLGFIGLLIGKRSLSLFFAVSTILAAFGVFLLTSQGRVGANPIAVKFQSISSRIHQFPKRTWMLPDQDLVQLDAGQIPISMMDRIGNNEIVVFPFNLLYAPVNNLTLSSFPIIQSYAAYTERLDRMQSDFLERSWRNNYILFEHLGIDWRNPVLDTPLAWQSMLRWYHVSEKSDSLMLLERNKTPRQVTTTSLSTQSRYIYDVIEIPHNNQLIYAKIYLKQNPIGHLAQLFYRIPPVHLNLQSIDSQIYEFRLMPETISSGIPISSIPVNLEETWCVFEGCQQNKFVSFHLTGQGLLFYQDQIQIEFYLLDYIE